VVDLVTTRRTTRGDSVHPVVVYQADGVSYRFQNPNAMGMFSQYRIGDRVEVLYPQDQPGEGSINSFSDLWLLPLICGILGFGMLTVYFCVWRGIGLPRTTPNPEDAWSR
jgi:hypothetical protein